MVNLSFEPALDVDFDVMIINLANVDGAGGGDLSEPLIRICYIDPFFFVVNGPYLVIRILFYYWSMNRRRGEKERPELKCFAEKYSLRSIY